MAKAPMWEIQVLKALCCSSGGSNAQDGFNNQDVGEENKDGVYSCSSYESNESQNTINLIVRTSQLDHIRMETIRMIEHMVLAKGQSFKKQYQSHQDHYPPDKNGKPHFNNSGISQDDSISQWVTYGNEVVKGHCQEHRGLYDSKELNEECLGNEGMETDLSCIEPEYAQCSAQC